MTDCFRYQNDILHVEDVSLAELARQYGTPLYVYSRAHLRAQYQAFAQAFAAVQPVTHYAIKANSNAAVIACFAQWGAGADVVSGGELYRARRAGIPAAKIAFAGVGKTVAEIEAALAEDIGLFTVESEAELERLNECAGRVGRKARIALRVNPDVDPKTHKFTSTGKQESKFGVDLARAEAAYQLADRLAQIEIAGLHLHLGSPLMTPDPYLKAFAKVAPFCAALKARYPTFRLLDLGGGFGIPYRPDDQAFDLEGLAAALTPGLLELGLEIHFEPGRFFTGNAGVLLCEVQYLKDNPFRQFVIVDAAMNDLIRPALYEAYHQIDPVRTTAGRITGDVVGPVCECGDFLAVGRDLPAVRAGDLLAVRGAGAYGFAMASTYNSRPRPAEIMVSGAQVAVVRARETQADLVRGEQVPTGPGWSE